MVEMTETTINEWYQEICARIETYYAEKRREARIERNAISWAELVETQRKWLAWACGQRNVQLLQLRGIQCL